MATGRRPGQGEGDPQAPGLGAAGPTQGPPSLGALGGPPWAGPATSHRPQPRVPVLPAWTGTGRPGPTSGVGLRRAASRLRDAPAPLLPASSVLPAPDWLSGPEPALHWPAGLPLGSGSAPSKRGSEVAVLGDHSSLPVGCAGVGRGTVGGQAFLRATTLVSGYSGHHLRQDRVGLRKRRWTQIWGDH